MSSREHQLISRIIRIGCLNEVLAWGINQSDFRISETRALFNHLLSYSQANRSVVGPNAAQQLYPTFQLCDDPYMQTDALCREVRYNRIQLDATQGITDIQVLLQANPAEAVARLQALSRDLTNLSGSNNTDVQLGDAMQRIYHEYHQKKAGFDFSLCRWPWENPDKEVRPAREKGEPARDIQEATGGLQPSDYIVFYGRPKSMKSWVLAFLIAWIFDKDKRAVIYTKEMGADDIYKRIISCIAEVDITGLRMGNLTVEEEWRLFYAMKVIDMAKLGGNLVTLSGQDCTDGSDTVPWLTAKLEKYKPHFCFIDGMYLMSDVRRAKKDHERVMNISRDLRQMTLQTKVGLAVTLQANRKAAGHSQGNLDEIAFSDAIGQDATHIFRVINEKNTPTVAVVTAGGREFDLNGWRIYAKPSNGDFRFHSILTDKDIEKAKEGDMSSDGAEGHGGHNGKKRQPLAQTPPPTHNTPSQDLQQTNRAVTLALNNGR